MIRRLLFVVLGTALLAPSVRAEVKLHPLFSDGMVLQQGKECAIWGTAEPGQQLSISLNRMPKPKEQVGVTSVFKVGEDGKWTTKLAIGHKRPGSEESYIPAGGPYVLTVIDFDTKKELITLKDVYVGEVWIASGQSNMEWSVNAAAGADDAKKNAGNARLRLFTVKKTAADKPQTTVPVDNYNGKWLEASANTIGPFSAVAYYFGRDLQKDLDVPVGIIHTSWGGTASEEWTSMKVLDEHPEHKDKHPRQSKLYNGMIAPLIPYAFKGAIWYQGESNAGRAELYRTGFPLMIKNWRDDWKQGDFPFLFVQLAPFAPNGEEPDPAWARLRDAQLETTRKVKNTAMAVITDVGEKTDIHPKKKEPVGHRLALAAEALAYGKKVEYSGPMFDKMKVDGNRAILSFKHLGGGLEARDGPLTGFTIAGEDKVFHPAEAEIVGDTIVISSKEVEKPVAVRFGWANYPAANLWNKAGLPASPFRTDDWEKAAKAN
jgi:sialate O-acetylesterase